PERAFAPASPALAHRARLSPFAFGVQHGAITSQYPMNVLEAHGLVKHYRGGDGGLIHILTGVDLAVRRGEMVAIVGASGAGKSTLLHVLGTLDIPTQGYVVVDGRSVQGLDEETLADLRNKRIGFVFQFHHLLREFTALENVMM